MTFRVSGRVVYVHGFLGADAMWQHVMRDGAVAVGLPGHETGQDHRRYLDAGATFFDAAIQFLSRLPEEQCTLVGYSMGARLALCAALVAPEQVTALVLIGANPGLPEGPVREERRAFEESLCTRIEEKGLASFVDWWQTRPLFDSQQSLSKEVLAAQRAMRLCHDPVQVVRAVRAMGLAAMPDLGKHLQELRMPVTWVAGENDVKFADIARRSAALTPLGRVQIISGCGHNPVLETR